MRNLTVNDIPIDLPTALEQYKRLNRSAKIQERDRVIFEEKFGIKDGVSKTYVEVGRKFNVSPTRVRQICGRTFFRVGIEC